jgi:hypothetical protein
VLLTYETSEDAGRDPVLKAWATSDWVLAMRHGAYALDGRNWNRAT